LSHTLLDLFGVKTALFKHDHDLISGACS